MVEKNANAKANEELVIENIPMEMPETISNAMASWNQQLYLQGISQSFRGPLIHLLGRRFRIISFTIHEIIQTEYVLLRF